MQLIDVIMQAIFTFTCSSLDATKEHDTKTVQHLASHFNLSVKAFGKQLSDVDAPAYGTLELSDAFIDGVEPAPITPSSGDEAGAYRLLAGTIKSVYRAHHSVTDDDTVIISPGIMSGNTGMLQTLMFYVVLGR